MRIRSSQKTSKTVAFPPVFILVIFVTALVFSLTSPFTSYSFDAIEEPVALEIIEVMIAAPLIVDEAPGAIIAPQPVAPVVAEPIVAPAQAHIVIPSINLNANIEDMGLTPEGAMAVPASVTAGWFSYGTRPGDTGSAVIGGHNTWNGADGVFYRLEELRIGDVISIVDAQGVSTSFVVRETRLYDPTADATEIFTSTTGTHLNVITCSGVFDTSTDSYTKRFVVFTDSQN